MLLNDEMIRDAVHQFKMLEPYLEPTGKEPGVISRGLSHAGYDLRLGYIAMIYKNSWNEIVDPKRFTSGTHSQNMDYQSRLFDTLQIKDGDTMLVPAHGYILAYSLEYIRMPRHLKGRCVGKSTYARCGLVVNTTPAEPGWEGHLTIEIANTGPCPVRIYPGEGIAQMEFEVIAGGGPKLGDYGHTGGKYQCQTAEPVPARMK